MSISSIFEPLRKVVEDNGHVTMRLGEEHLDLLEEYIGQQAAKPSIIWVPIGAASIEPIAGPRAPTARRLVRPTVPPSTPGTGAATDTARVEEPAMYASRPEQIDAYVWAPDLPTCELVLNDFVAFLRLSMTGFSFKPATTRWAVGSDRKPKRGSLCIFRFVAKVPFTFPDQNFVASPLTLTLTPEIDDN